MESNSRKDGCRAKVDLWFANDESGSVSDLEFALSLKFLKQISERFYYSDSNGAKGGIIAWSNTTTNVIMPITEDFANIANLYTQRYFKHGTNLPRAMRELKKLILNEDGSANRHGRRNGVKQVAIVLTDASKRQLIKTNGWVATAEALKQKNVSIIMILIDAAKVAYDSDLNIKQMIDSVTDKKVIAVPNYTDASNPAQKHIDVVVKTICNEVPVPVPADWGDAPDTYGTDNISNNSGNDAIGANHNLSNNLYLGGSKPDAENSGQPNSAAHGDGWEEDGVSVPNVFLADSSYTIPADQIEVMNTSGKIATVHGFVDFNRDGDFDDKGESATTTVLPNESHPTSDLKFEGFEKANNIGKTYARFRVSTENDLKSGDNAPDGEVEDYALNVIAFDPCCPPWNRYRMEKLLKYVPSAGISAPYSLTMDTNLDPNFSQSMQNYIDYLHSLDPAIVNITIGTHAFDRGTGEDPQTGWPSNKAVCPTVTNRWTALGQANTSLNNLPLAILKKDRWYGIKTGIWLNNSIQFFPRKCGENNLYVRWETRLSAERSSTKNTPRLVFKAMN